MILHAMPIRTHSRATKAEQIAHYIPDKEQLFLPLFSLHIYGYFSVFLRFPGVR